MTKTGRMGSSPCVWAVVLGYNHVEDSLECLKSVSASRLRDLRIVYVDNGSDAGVSERVLAEIPSCAVLRLEPNAGVAGGLNAGIQYACAQGADHVIIFNNDTTVAPDGLAHLSAAATANPQAGLVVPKIFYYDHPEMVWSAGSFFRRFPPVMVMRKTRGRDDGRHDADRELDAATFCVILLTRPMLDAAGLLDTDYHFMYEDYDLCMRVREAGFGIHFTPEAHVWHKISKTTGAGTRKLSFWNNYGRSEVVFRRKFRRYRWLTGWTHALFIILRFVAEGHVYGVMPYLRGWLAGSREPLHSPPRLGDAATGRVLREASPLPR
jgi:GT2 family glycosyltransferase